MNTDPRHILLTDYTYDLPNERIAHRPLSQRDASKLLVYKSGNIADDRFSNLARHLPPDSLLVLNNTKVIEARILFQKPSGGVIEVFCLEPNGQSMELALQQQGEVRWKCLIGGASKWKPGQVLQKQLTIDGAPVLLQAVYEGKVDDGFVIRFAWLPGDLPFVRVLHTAGAIPLPPYIKRKTEELDAERYQTIFGRHAGSVAAPTAALHFTDDVFESLRARRIATDFVTLNVGAGTFKPVKTETIGNHHMHGEDFTVDKNTVRRMADTATVVAVGTTSLRTMESLYWLGVKLLSGRLQAEWTLEQWEVYGLPGDVPPRQSLEAVLHWMTDRGVERLHCRTSLLIAPGYAFRMPSAMVTNFHQPGSTLLLLIAAFVGPDWQAIYRHALHNDYRFLSYGDSSLLWRSQKRDDG